MKHNGFSIPYIKFLSTKSAEDSNSVVKIKCNPNDNQDAVYPGYEEFKTEVRIRTTIIIFIIVIIITVFFYKK